MASPCTSAPRQPGLGEIFASLGSAFLRAHALSQRQRQAFRAVAACRTAALGGALWQCQACGHRLAVYHSCRDRHCPRCQAMARFRWVSDRVAEVLPVPYFHTVFTLPHGLNDLIRDNPKALIGCLFRSVSQTLLTFAKNPKHLGAEPGLVMVLHTWGRRLNYHVHLHCIVTGGGLSPDHQKWVSIPNRRFLFPVRALSKVFTGKYLAAVDHLVAKGEVFTDGDRHRVLDLDAWRRRRRALTSTPWVVYAKQPFGGPVQVLKYLGAYTHRVGISDRRIVAFEAGKVTFAYKDYRDQGRQRQMTLPAAEFANRFLMHVLPKGLMRIRYAGILAHCKKKKALAVCRNMLGAPDLADFKVDDPTEAGSEARAATTERGRECPACGSRALVLAELLAAGSDRSKPVILDSS